VLFLPFENEILRVEEHIRACVQAEGRLLQEVAEYCNLGGGKKLRPRFLILVARAVSGSPQTDDAVLRAAAATELVHLASLLHDDVIDKTTMRRGRPSVNAQYGDNVAILMADLLFAHAFDLALSTLEPQITRLLAQTTRLMCESEIFQIERAGQNLSREDYYYIIRCKTAALFSLCAEVGGFLGGAPDKTRRALAEFGRLIGMTYQITDDVLDYTALGEQWGKPQGHDLSEGKLTLPVVYTCEQATPEDREALLSELRNGRQMDRVLPILQKYGGLEFSEGQARKFAREAQELIPTLALRQSDDLFQALCRFASDRTF
jgi:octaprenyl-diphosphate synthase